MIKRDRLWLFPFLAVLFILSFLLRIRKIHMDVLGDEALYYYLSKTLGIAPKSMRDLLPLWTHVSVRPFMYVFYFPWAQLGFTAYRVVSILVGCTVPCLLLVLSVRMRANPYLAACFALVASLHPQFILFSVVGFPDMLATALLFCGLLAYHANSVRWATLFFCVTVLAKESFAMFLVTLLVDGVVALRRNGQKLVLAPLAGLLAVAITNGFEVYVLHGPPQGWSNNGINSDFYAGFLCSFWFIPFGLLLLLYKEYRVLAIGLGAPAFFYVWGNVLKKGVDSWYIIGPLAVALLVATVVVQRAVETLRSCHSTPGSDLRVHLPWLGPSKSLLSAAVFLVLLWAPANTGWRQVDLEKSLAALGEPWSRPGTIALAADALGKMRPSHLLVMDAFWGFSYYPFGLLASKHVSSMCTEENDNCRPNESRLREALLRHTEIIWANKNLKWARTLRPLLKDCQVFRNSEFTIYKLNGACRKHLEDH